MAIPAPTRPRSPARLSRHPPRHRCSFDWRSNLVCMGHLLRFLFQIGPSGPDKRRGTAALGDYHRRTSLQ